MGAPISHDADADLETEIVDLGLHPSGEREAVSTADAPADALPERIGGRYQVHDLLGRGGMAAVYRVTDSASGRQLALKQLMVAETSRHFRELCGLFEREFHTLVQLSHPRIIEAYDYGMDSAGPYYTMELLDGGDLRERSPLPWRDACSLLYDVCSSLALLHSRRLVHRDISPRNVRSTRDGSAKLIDFGALVPMGASGQIVGTPPFVAPEVLHRSALDARTDLFSLGATLYFALTGRLAFPARDFSKLQEAWAKRPPPPSSVVAGIPPALDALVMSLIGIDPAVRPRTAFEVMQRLAAIAGIERVESVDVSQAYLSTPVMVGRDQALASLRALIRAAQSGRGGAMLIEGVAGIGRSRMLDAAALEAKTAGATVLRASGSTASGEVLSVANALLAQLVEALPEVAFSNAEAEKVASLLFESVGTGTTSKPAPRDLSAASGERPAVQSALSRWLLRVSSGHPLVILVDDVHSADDASVAVLASLAWAARAKRLLLVVAAETGAAVRAADAFRVLRQDCAPLVLSALSRPETAALLTSVFGDVPNVALLSDRIDQLAAGNPRESLELAQWLVAKGVVRYEGGNWSLPSRLDVGDLPNNAEETFRERVGELSVLARSLAEAHALASHRAFSREDYARVAGAAASGPVDEAITELLSRRMLASDGRAYVLSHRGWSDALIAGLGQDTRTDRHRALAELYAKDDGLRLERAYHLLLGGREDLGLDLLMQLIEIAPASHGLLGLTQMSAGQIAVILDRALDSAQKLRRSPREAHEIGRSLASISVNTDDAYYLRAAPEWFARLKQDSGLAFYDEITDAASPADRLMRALTLASEQYAATAPADRVWSPEAAIRGLVTYVMISIAIGSRTQDGPLLMSLPSLLEPFAALSPIIAAIWKNALATRESNCDCLPERALVRWREVEAALANVGAGELSYVDALRGAIAYGIGLVEARLGLASAERRADVLDKDPFQRVSAMYLRKVARLHQGDFDGSERFRKRAELLALQASNRQMFTSTLVAELVAHAMASDLIGIRQAGDAIEPYAARYLGWQPYRHMADGCFEQCRGQLEAARKAFERGLLLCEPQPQGPPRSLGPWPRLEAAYIEVLVGLGLAAQAKARGDKALALCAERGIDAAALTIRRALALAEAKLGHHAQASERLEAVARELIAHGITGLELGATYEMRTRVAIWASDKLAIEEYGRLTANEYRHGEGSPLGARYERLMDEARSAGVHVLPQLTDFETKLTTSTWSGHRTASAVEAVPGRRADRDD
jgi:hypothetical protein